LTEQHKPYGKRFLVRFNWLKVQEKYQMSEENKALARRYFEEIWNQGNLDVIPEIIAANHVHHDPANPGASGPEGMKQLVSMYRAAFPDTRFTVEDQIAEGAKVVTRWTARGTHQGELMGIAPTNKTMELTGMDIHRIVNGMIEEHWSNWDTIGLLQQLGVVPAPGEGGA
jgi:steroid delta-isomerase-like uncharacterized protein